MGWGSLECVSMGKDVPVSAAEEEEVATSTA